MDTNFTGCWQMLFRPTFLLRALQSARGGGSTYFPPFLSPRSCCSPLSLSSGSMSTLSLSLSSTGPPGRASSSFMRLCVPSSLLLPPPGRRGDNGEGGGEVTSIPFSFLSPTQHETSHTSCCSLSRPVHTIYVVGLFSVGGESFSIRQHGERRFKSNSIIKLFPPFSYWEQFLKMSARGKPPTEECNFRNIAQRLLLSPLAITLKYCYAYRIAILRRNAVPFFHASKPTFMRGIECLREEPPSIPPQERRPTQKKTFLGAHLLP